MPDNSKMVADKAKDSESVQAAGTANLEKILEAMLRDFKVPKEATASLTKAIVAELKRRSDGMVSADQAHAAELADDDPARAERDTAVAGLRKVVVDCRTSVATAHGESAAGELGLTGRTPEDPQLLANTAGTVLTRLGQWKPRPSILEDYVFKPEVWIGRLKAALPPVTAALSKVATEAREADVTRVARDQAIEHNDEGFSKGATLMSALLYAAGEDELAAKLRPSPKRSGRTTGGVDGQGDIAPPPAAPTAAA